VPAINIGVNEVCKFAKTLSGNIFTAMDYTMASPIIN
jgi:hypothetical protein